MDLDPYEIRRFGRGALNDLAVSPRGDLLAVATGTGVWLHHLDEQQDEDRLLLQGDSVNALSWSPQGDRLASGTDDGVWVQSLTDEAIDHLGSGECGQTGIRQLAWSPDGSRIVYQCTKLYVADAATGQLLATMKDVPPVGEMVWSPDGKYLAISFPDGVGKKMSDGLGVWRADTGQLSRILVKDQPLLQIEDLAWTTSTGGLAVLSHPVEITETEGGAERQRRTGPSKIQVWNPDTGELGREIVAQEVLDSMAWGPGADRFATAGNVVTLRGATSGEPIATFEDCGADDLSWAVAGNRLAAGSRGGEVCVWDASTGKLSHRFAGYSAFTGGADWSLDGKQVTETDGSSTYTWEASSGQLLAALQPRACCHRIGRVSPHKLKGIGSWYETLPPVRT